jgi:hypothetical protein
VWAYTRIKSDVRKTFTDVLTKVLSSWIFRIQIRHFENPLLSSLRFKRLDYGTAVDISNKTVSMTKTPRFNNISTGYSTICIQIRLSAMPTLFLHPDREEGIYMAREYSVWATERGLDLRYTRVAPFLTEAYLYLFHYHISTGWLA